jgi:hypothetical protein
MSAGVGMELDGHPPIGQLDLIEGGSPGHVEQSVEVEGHGSSTAQRQHDQVTSPTQPRAVPCTPMSTAQRQHDQVTTPSPALSPAHP